MNERRESSALRQQLCSVRMGLDTANHLLESRGAELAAAHDELDMQRQSVVALETQQRTSQAQIHELRAYVESLRHELQLSKDKDPLLADQLKVRFFY